MKNVSEELARKHINKKEQLIKEAIDYIAGDTWTLEDVAERGRMGINCQTKEETFIFDDIPLLVFMPFEIEYSQKDLSFMATISLNYRKLYNDKPNEIKLKDRR